MLGSLDEPTAIGLSPLSPGCRSGTLAGSERARVRATGIEPAFSAWNATEGSDLG